MVRRLCVVAALLGLVASTPAAQSADARAALQAALNAMSGGIDVKTLQVSAAGWSSDVGQTYGLDEDWPKFEVANFVQLLDYSTNTSREDYDRRRGTYPLNGRSPRPDTHVTQIFSGGYAWNVENNTPVPFTRLYLDGAPYSDVRALELALTPYGALKAGIAAGNAATAITLPIVGPSDFGLSQFGRKVTIVSFPMLGGKYRMNVTINDENLVELIDTWIPNPVYGDMDYEMRYTRYKEYGGIKYPSVLHVHHADARLNPAHNFYNYDVTDVKVNPPVPAIPVPDAVRNATLAPVRVEPVKLADGVWMLGGGTHNSLLVEFNDHLGLIDAPNNEDRSLAIIAAAETLAPGKLIRYVVNTHHHMDHAGGLRAFFSQGTTIVTHESNKEYYLQILFSPTGWSLKPDRMAFYNPMYMISRRPAPIETVGGVLLNSSAINGTAQYGLTDGSRIVQVIKVQDMSYELGDNSYDKGNHSQDMLMAYLPKEKILFNADLYSIPQQGPAPATATAAMRTLRQNILKWKLDVAQHVPAHGRVATNDEFLKAFGSTTVSK